MTFTLSFDSIYIAHGLILMGCVLFSIWAVWITRQIGKINASIKSLSPQRTKGMVESMRRALDYQEVGRKLLMVPPPLPFDELPSTNPPNTDKSIFTSSADISPVDKMFADISQNREKGEKSPKNAEEYRQGFEKSDIKKGDKVRVVRAPVDGEHYPPLTYGWPQAKEDAIGNVYRVRYHSKKFVALDGILMNCFPYFLLEKVNPTTLTSHEQYMEWLKYSGLKEKDQVKILSSIKPQLFGWKGDFKKHKYVNDTIINKTATITMIDEHGSVILNCEGETYCAPYFALEKITCPTNQ
jgi:hypothetical protein